MKKRKGEEFSGGATSYYTVAVDHPVSIRKPYSAECIDIIEALEMTFDEGEAFKAIWRMCAGRAIKRHKAGGSRLYDAEKVEFYGHRMAELERRSSK